jgi:hypothetical protein
MRIRIEELQALVQRAIDEDRSISLLRNEVKRVLGPAVIVEGSVEQLAEATNDRLDVLDRTGRSSRLDFDKNVFVGLIAHKNSGVRKLAARVLPEKFINRMVFDKNSAVRSTIARRLQVGAVSAMLKKFPHDDELRLIYKHKKLAESGVKQPKVVDEPFDMYGEERLGDAVKQSDGPDLSEQWYKTRAINLMRDYGRNIEHAWEETATRQYAANVKATSGIEIDETKLLDAIKELIKEKEDIVLERDALKETLAWLRSKDDELLVESNCSIIDEGEKDPVMTLVSEDRSSQSYIDEANKLFNIKESTLPQTIRKYRLGEQDMRSENIPIIGLLPHELGFRSIDEKALDMYCECWNKQQLMRGEPLKLAWSVHPEQVNKISFNVVLR